MVVQHVEDLVVAVDDIMCDDKNCNMKKIAHHFGFDLYACGKYREIRENDGTFYRSYYV